VGVYSSRQQNDGDMLRIQVRFGKNWQ